MIQEVPLDQLGDRFAFLLCDFRQEYVRMILRTAELVDLLPDLLPGIAIG